MEWIEPKTDWVLEDRFNYVDYNRIKNNLSWLHKKAEQLWKPIDFEDMGEDILNNEPSWSYVRFNQFERNLESINQNILTKDYGQMQTFFANGVFIKWDELNRIESASLSMHSILVRHEQSLERLPFRLGAPRFCLGGSKIKYPVVVTKSLSFRLGAPQFPVGGEKIKIPAKMEKRLPFILREEGGL